MQQQFFAGIEDDGHVGSLCLADGLSSDVQGIYEQAIGNGGANYQGDIKLTPEQYEVIVKGKPKSRSSKLVGHWPRTGSVVNIPYILAGTGCDFSEDERAKIARAIDEYKDNTCIRYKKQACLIYTSLRQL